MSIQDVSRTVKDEILYDCQLTLQRSNTVAAAAVGAGSLQRAVAVAVMPLAAVSVAFQRIGTAILFTAVAILRQSARLFGLDSQRIDNFVLQMQAWRVSKALDLSTDHVVVKETERLGETPRVVTEATADTFQQPSAWYSRAWNGVSDVMKRARASEHEVTRKIKIAVAVIGVSVYVLGVCASYYQQRRGGYGNPFASTQETCPEVSPDALQGKSDVGKLLTIDPQCPQQAWSVLMPDRNMSDLRNGGVWADIKRSFRQLTQKVHPDKLAETEKAAYPHDWQDAQRNLGRARDTLEYCQKNIEHCLGNYKVTDTMLRYA